MSKKIYKYPTGASIPKNATYLSTVTQTKEYNKSVNDGEGGWVRCWLVWHYFLVDSPSQND